MIFLLELLEPAGAIRFQMAFRVTNRACKKSRLLADNGVRQGQPLFLMVPRPVGKSSFDVWELAFRPFNRRSGTILLIQVLVLLAQHFGDSASFNPK